MDTKFCVDCGQKNITTAKFCFGCGFSFASMTDGTHVAQTTAPAAPSKPQPPVNRKQKQVIIYEDDGANEEDLLDEDGQKMVIEVDQEFANDFANLVIAKFETTPRKGIKIEEVVNTAKPTENRKVLARRKNTEAIPLEDIVAVEIRGASARPARPTRQSRRK